METGRERIFSYDDGFISELLIYLLKIVRDNTSIMKFLNTIFFDLDISFSEKEIDPLVLQYLDYFLHWFLLSSFLVRLHAWSEYKFCRRYLKVFRNQLLLLQRQFFFSQQGTIKQCVIGVSPKIRNGRVQKRRLHLANKICDKQAL